jgi:undecaprenyl-diphosphatase
MLDWIINLDTKIFYFINSARCSAADWFFSILSAHLFIGLVVFSFALYLIISRFKKQWWLLVIMIGLSFLLADRISVMCFKDVVCRLRPSHALEGVILCKLHNFQLITDDKGGLYGFVSSHAANVFSITTFFLFFIKNKWLKITLLLWASLTCYSRIYCGYHYPLDVVCGALLGVAIGLFLRFIFNQSRYRNILSPQ